MSSIWVKSIKKASNCATLTNVKACLSKLAKCVYKSSSGEGTYGVCEEKIYRVGAKPGSDWEFYDYLDSSSLSSGTIIGITILALFILILFGALLYFLCNKNSGCLLKFKVDFSGLRGFFLAGNEIFVTTVLRCLGRMERPQNVATNNCHEIV